MNMNWFESLIYGIVSGLTEFMPISSYAHQQIVLHIIGSDSRDPMRDLFVHIALLISLYTCCRSIIDQIRRERTSHSHHRRSNRHNTRTIYELKVIRNASICIVLGMLLLSFVYRGTQSLFTICVFLLINGIVIFISGRTLQGNKEACSMSLMDSFIIGISGAFSCFPGMSRMALTTTSAIVRGANKQHALNWSLMISIPALLLFCGFDLISIFTVTGGVGFWHNLLNYLLSAFGAYLSGCLSIFTMRVIIANYDFSKFAYYAWGSALFTFIIYLTVV